MKKRKDTKSRDKDKNLGGNISAHTLDWDLKWGSKGLKISVSLLSLLTLLFLITSFFIIKNISKLPEILFRSPERGDLLIIFAGILLFVAVPFMWGIYIGNKSKKRKA